MRTYTQTLNKTLPEQGVHQAGEAITGANTAPFQWQMGNRSFDPYNETATLEVRHSWDAGQTFPVSRSYVFPCQVEWSIQDCYDQLLTLSHYINSTAIPE